MKKKHLKSLLMFIIAGAFAFLTACGNSEGSGTVITQAPSNASEVSEGESGHNTDKTTETPAEAETVKTPETSAETETDKTPETPAETGTDKTTEEPSGTDIGEITENPSRDYSGETHGVLNISINPEVEFEIDENGLVTKVIYLNEDARDAYIGLALEGIPVKEAIELVVKTADEKGYLKDGNDVSVSYGATGYATAEEAQEMIEAARTGTIEALNETGKDSALVLNMTNYSQDDEICDLCFGAGVIICDICGGISYGNGKLKCDLCEGSGFYDDGHDPDLGTGNCRTCHGTGIMTIQSETCRFCGGSGKCDVCGGTGQEMRGDGTPGPCHACLGTTDCQNSECIDGIVPEKHTTCTDCEGSGRASGDSSDPNDRPEGLCYRCDGEGFMTCYRCGGTLLQTCYRCDGTGKRIIREVGPE